MTFERLLAQMTVCDLARAEDWYSLLFERAPDARPMDGLLEWHLSETFGVQVFAEPERAGRSTMVLDDPDLDARAAALTDAGVDHGGVSDASTTRVLPLADPDGNRIVITGPLPT